jgi:hypothetical protein
MLGHYSLLVHVSHFMVYRLLYHLMPCNLSCWKCCDIKQYRCAPVSAGNIFQDLLRLREIMDNTERYI